MLWVGFSVVEADYVEVFSLYTTICARVTISRSLSKLLHDPEGVHMVGRMVKALCKVDRTCLTLTLVIRIAG